MPGFGDKEVVQSAIEGLASLDIVCLWFFMSLFTSHTHSVLSCDDKGDELMM